MVSHAISVPSCVNESHGAGFHKTKQNICLPNDENVHAKNRGSLLVYSRFQKCSVGHPKLFLALPSSNS